MNLCRSCGEDFGGVELFDRHRVGSHAYTFGEGLRMDPAREDGRRCLDADEMRELGWRLNARRRWIDPARALRAAHMEKRRAQRGSYGAAVSRLYTYIPLDFDQALKDGRLRVLDYALGCHLACESFRELNTNEGIVTAHISALADIFDCDPVTIRRALRRLKVGGWIDFPEPDERQRTPWPIRLTGLGREAQTKGTVTPRLRQESQTTATGVDPSRIAESPQERESSASSLRPSRARENETTRNEENPCSEETKLDHAGDKTTPVADARATDPSVTDRLIELVAVERSRRVAVERAEDGSLDWNREPQQGER